MIKQRKSNKKIENTVILDSHTHSKYSYDGHDTPERLCRQAIYRGVRFLTITDHCDMRQHPYGYQYYFPQAGKRFSEIECLREVLSDDLTLLNGIELGDISNRPDMAEQHLNTYHYDFVLGSVHHARDSYNIKDVRMLTPEQGLGLYFDEIDALLDFGNFDCLAHLDYPARIWHVPKYWHSNYETRILHILYRLADMGKALEVNSSGLFDSMGRVGPKQWVLEAFRTYGGRYVTIGSDAHYAEHIGRGLNEAIALLKRTGFTTVTLYEERKPIEIQFPLQEQNRKGQ